MGIELFWDNEEKTIMLCEFQQRWTWDDLFDTLNAIKKVTENAEREIGAIVDLRSGTTFPGGSFLSADNFEKAKRVLKMGDGGTGPIVIVGANSIVKTIYSTMAGLNSTAASNIHFADSLKQARAYLEKRVGVAV
jgi:hypothetical protein